MVLEEIDTYIEDDWDDNALTSRTNATEGYFLHPSDNLLSGDVEAGTALKGVYRPEWTIEQGSITAANQQLEIPAGNATNQKINTTSEFATGSSAIDFQFASSVSTGSLNTLFISDDAGIFSGNEYHIGANSNGDYNLSRRDSGTFNSIIVSSWTIDTNNHTKKLERDSYGNFEYYLDATSKGTATDTAYGQEIAEYIGIVNTVDSQVNIDNLVIQ